MLRKELSRKIVDVNGRPIPISNRYKLKTEKNGKEQPIIWWEVQTNTKPIIGMDNYDKLWLQLIQRPTNGNKFFSSGRRNQVKLINDERNKEKKQSNQEVNSQLNIDEDKIEQLKKKVKERLKNQFQVNKTVKNFEHDLQFKPKMEIKQQKGRRIPIHMQKAVETELEKLIKEGHLKKLEEVG